LCIALCCISCTVLGKISDHVAGGLDAGGAPGEAGGSGGIDAGGVVHKIGGEVWICLNLLVSEISGQLMDDGGDHFQVAEFFSTYKGVKTVPSGIEFCGVVECIM